MIRRALAIVAVLLVLLAVLALHALPAASDVPVVSGVVPAGEFEAIRSAGTAVVGTSQPTPALLESRTLTTAAVPAPSAAVRNPELRAAGPLGGSVAPSARAVPSVAPVQTGEVRKPQQPAASVTGTNTGLGKAPAASAISKGTASWFDSPIGVSAAGPALRAAIGAGWRGRQVSVCAGQRCVSTILGDWCACPRRAIDLDAPVFAALAPLSQGIVEVTISW